MASVWRSVIALGRSTSPVIVELDAATAELGTAAAAIYPAPADDAAQDFLALRSIRVPFPGSHQALSHLSVNTILFTPDPRGFDKPALSR